MAESVLVRAADLVWRRLPRRVGSVSPTLGVLLRDGDWLLPVPIAALLLPVASLAAGVAVAVGQTAPLWSYDVLPAFVLGIAGALGAACGIWAAIGYLIGLFGFWKPEQGTLSGTLLGGGSYDSLRLEHGFFYSFTHSYLGLLVAAAVLLQLAVIVPAAVAGCRGVLSRALRRHRRARLAVEGLVGVALFAVLAWQWTKAYQYTIRPYWTFGGGYPDVAAFNPPRDHATQLWLVIGAVAAGRALLTVALPQPKVPLRRLAPIKPLRMWWLIGVPAQALLVTLLAGGVLNDAGQGLVFGAVVAGGLILRRLILPRIPGLSRLVNAVPIVLRLAAIAAVGYLASNWRVGAAYAKGAEDLVSFAETAAISIGAAAILLVARQPDSWLPAWMRPAKRPPAAPPPHSVSQQQTVQLRRPGAPPPQWRPS